MKYQLVLQFPNDSFSDENATGWLEEELTKILGESVYVDGHDLGPDYSSIFVFTADPVTTFENATELLERRDLLETVTAAHRQVGDETFTVIWPKDYRREFRIS